jgi:hypothetical protein
MFRNILNWKYVAITTLVAILAYIAVTITAVAHKASCDPGLGIMTWSSKWLNRYTFYSVRRYTFPQGSSTIAGSQHDLIAEKLGLHPWEVVRADSQSTAFIVIAICDEERREAIKTRLASIVRNGL